MPDITVTVRGKQAKAAGSPVIVCGNTDYTLHFDLDAEWQAHDLKTARFVYRAGGGMLYQEVLFTGHACAVPLLHDTCEVAVGLYAGSLRTTAPALIPCARCVTDGFPLHPDPAPDVYEQLLAYLKAMQTDSAPPPVSAVFCAAGFLAGTVGAAESEGA